MCRDEWRSDGCGAASFRTITCFDSPPTHTTFHHQVIMEPLKTVEQFCEAISAMHVRGAGCIGVTAGYGMYCAAVEASRAAEGLEGAVALSLLLQMMQNLVGNPCKSTRTADTSSACRCCCTTFCLVVIR